MKPKLTFFCELPASDLLALFDDPVVIENLCYLDATISMGILDLSPERAKIVQRLNQAGIPVTAWQLLPKEEGYWYNTRNAPQASMRYMEFKEWSHKYNLQWAGIGVDIEPAFAEMSQFSNQPARLLPLLWKRLWDSQTVTGARAAYSGMVTAMHHDGYTVESYQFPIILDERKAGSTILQRVAGIVDLDVDREILMLYTSFMRPNGPGIFWSYAQEAGAVGIGNTGGGVDIKGVVDLPPITWEEFQRDLLLAHRLNKAIYIFSLEGCVQQGFLARLKSFNWEQLVQPPVDHARKVSWVRDLAHVLLWASARPLVIIVLLILVNRLLKGSKKRH